MSDLIRELRRRVDAIVEPHIAIYGPDAPPVKMALRVLAEAEMIDRQLSERKVGTAEAAERTSWHEDTLHKWARAKIAGEQLPPEWEGLSVERTQAGYAFVLSTIPEHPRAA